MLVDGIKYQKIGGKSYFSQERFTTEELNGYLNAMKPSDKSIFDYVIYDSGIEEQFIKELEMSDAVKVYTKLPNWFKISTPMGSYNPDWAILANSSNGDRMYFVAETKGSPSLVNLSGREKAKVKCGELHFAALNDANKSIEYRVVRTLKDLLR